MASRLESFSKWLQIKLYQFEVTFPVYIFTPVEKFIFYSVLFLLISLTFIATVLYLPQHVQFVLSRAWFYMHGDGDSSAADLIKAGAEKMLGSSSSSFSSFLSTTSLHHAATAAAEAAREL